MRWFPFLLLSSLSACSSGSPPAPSASAKPAVQANASPGEAPPPRTRAGRFALVHVTVVDVEKGTKLPDRAVVVEGDRIVAVVASDAVPASSPPTSLIEARGKYVIPGLWDMHVHFNDPVSGKLFIANGVTGVRVMWGRRHAKGASPSHFILRAGFDAKQTIGPRMVIASEILDGPKPFWPAAVALSTPAEGRRAVDDAKRNGFDFIKVYTLLPRDVYEAIASESKKRAMPFVGHTPDSVTVAEASDAGQKSIEHLTGVFLGCSSREEELRSRPHHSAKARPTYNNEAIHSYDPARAGALFAKFVANGTWHCPTLTESMTQSTLDDPSHERDPRLRYVSSFVKKRWDPRKDFRSKDRTPADYEGMRATFRHRLTLVGAMNKAGVPLLAGTDESNPYVFAGFMLHDELVWLVRAGLTPVEALRTATSNPARFFGWDAKMGTVTPGKVADLVVLDADPTTDINNTRRIFAVVSRGTLHSRPALDRMLHDVSIAAQKQ